MSVANIVTITNEVTIGRMSVANEMVQYLPRELYRYLNRPAPLGGGAKYLYGYARIKCAHGPVYSYGCRSEKEHLQRMLSWGLCTADRNIGVGGKSRKFSSCRSHHQYLATLGYLIGAYPKPEGRENVMVSVAAACGLENLFRKSLTKYLSGRPADFRRVLRFAADYRFILLAEKLSRGRFCVTNVRPGFSGIGTTLIGYFTLEGGYNHWYMVALGFLPELEYSEAPRWLAEQKGRIYTVNPPRFEPE